MKRLLQGYARFRANVFPRWQHHFHLLADRQAPETLFITCADSRVVPNLIFQTEPGDLFLCRNAGNVVPPHGEMAGGVSATIEYAVEVLRVRHVVVCGHSDCGAVKATLPPDGAPLGERRDLSHLPLTAKWLGFIEPAWRNLEQGTRTDDPRALHTALIHANVVTQIENLKTHPEVARGLSEQTLHVHGWYYDILTGAIESWDEHVRRFVPLEEVSAAKSPTLGF